MSEPNLTIFMLGILGTVLIGAPLVVGIMLRDVWKALKFAGVLWVAPIAAFGIFLLRAWVAGGFND